jgi:hypothetical protein
LRKNRKLNNSFRASLARKSHRYREGWRNSQLGWAGALDGFSRQINDVQVDRLLTGEFFGLGHAVPVIAATAFHCPPLLNKVT